MRRALLKAPAPTLSLDDPDLSTDARSAIAALRIAEKQADQSSERLDLVQRALAAFDPRLVAMPQLRGAETAVLLPAGWRAMTHGFHAQPCFLSQSGAWRGEIGVSMEHARRLLGQVRS